MTTVTKEEQRIADDLFTLFDGDNNGTLSVNELEKGLRSATGENPTKTEIDEILAKAGVDKGKPITKDQFTKTVAKYVQDIKKKGKDKNTLEQEYRDAFKLFDRNGDETVARKELSVALKKLGEKMTDAEVNEMFDAADKDKDGKINYKEFVSLFTKDIKKIT